MKTKYRITKNIFGFYKAEYKPWWPFSWFECWQHTPYSNDINDAKEQAMRHEKRNTIEVLEEWHAE